jgi:hypothetical protein
MARERKQPAKEEGPRQEYPQPDKLQVTARQAAYLSELSGIASEKLAGKTHAALEDILRWKIDPHLLFYQRVCGQVVRPEPGTGVLQAVPNATVHVEDTDCSFLGFFPWEGPWIWWWWFWPIFCNREEIATTMTDECGKFCVWIPRWDIDRILRFRKERICFPEIYRPTIRDFLEELRPVPVKKPPFPDPPFPPDPPPFDVFDREILEQVGDVLGGRSLDLITQFAERRSFGQQTGELTALLDEPAFVNPFPPPLNDEKLKRLEQLDLEERLSERFDKPKFDLAELRPLKAIGPFLRCRDVFVAEWEYISDVPDITFRVTQDVDLDGDEELIYSEAFFDVRWNAGPIPDVTLQASPIARPSPICKKPVVACTNKPAIVTVGLMPLAASHHDNTTGHATRVNRPRPGGLFADAPTSPAQAPYAGTLQLHGCNHLAGAAYYRLLYSYEGATEVPFLGLEWYPPKLTGPPWWFQAVPDGAGWYEVLPEAQLVFPHWLLNWPTTNGPNGQYEVRLELGDTSKTTLASPGGFSDPVTFTIDNSKPLTGFDQIRWRVLGGSYLSQNTYPWPFSCIVIRRPAATDIEIEVSWSASAVHFRSAALSASGCGAGNPTLTGPMPPPPLEASREHWHENFMDNNVTKTALYSLAGSLPQGSYSFSIDAYSRAFNPAGDGGGPGTNWLDDYNYIHVNPSVALSVINI